MMVEESRREFLKKVAVSLPAVAFLFSSLPVSSVVMSEFSESSQDSREVEERTDDPSKPENGKIWFRKDLS